MTPRGLAEHNRRMKLRRLRKQVERLERRLQADEALLLHLQPSRRRRTENLLRALYR